ncbi:MAG: transposase, partial [Deltaproteobacteria bacterium]|nr:transposase [Deltaproteobacteria bacterium]
MTRAWRIEYEGALYHALSRGNERGPIVFDDQDRKMFVDCIGQMAERFETDVFAYVLMDNHYHLLFRTPRANLSKCMHWFGVTYTNRFNSRHARSGHLFQGRFKNMVVENDAYLLQLSYYIHRNPLRAGMVKRLASYRWSSYRAYAYGKAIPAWLNTEMILSQFVNVDDKHSAYRQHAQRYSKEEQRLWEDLRHGIFLGSQAFSEKIKKRYLPAVPNAEMPVQKQLKRNIDADAAILKAAKILSCDPQHYRKTGRISAADKEKRDLLIYLLWQTGQLTNQQIGVKFGLSYSAVSRRVRIFKDLL